jgi:dipeptidase E
MRRLLLLSNSTMPGMRPLEHAEAAIRKHLAGVRRVLFVPHALHDRAGYAARLRERFAALDLALDALDEDDAPERALANAAAVYVGGGNTFRLLHALQTHGWLEPLRARALGGMPYLAASAGTNVATRSIQTTNDMPIVQPPSFAALGLVPFNINPHYLDPDPTSTHMGETREQRLREFHEMNDAPVVGLREGAWLEVEGDRCTLGGSRDARLFVKGREPTEHAPGDDLSFLLR